MKSPRVTDRRTEEFFVEALKIRDIPRLHKLVDSLSERSKRHFHPHIFGTKLTFLWLLAQVAICVSAIPVFRKILLRVYPKAVIYVLVARNRSHIAGFVYVKIVGKLPDGRYVAYHGDVIHDSFQNRGLGEMQRKAILDYAKSHDIGKFVGIIVTDNVRSIHLVQKHGWRIDDIAEKSEEYNGELLDNVKVSLDIQ